MRLADVMRAVDTSSHDVVDYYGLANKSPRLHFETYEMPGTPGLSALRDLEDSPFAPDKVKAQRAAWRSVNSERPKGLDWYHAVNEPEVPAELQPATDLDPSLTVRPR
jgi:hypothetical protein